MNKPLVSLTVICYQAEKFVKEAVEGALSQTYSPLEIIFSDDASTDNTFSIIQEMTSSYTGPHTVILNKNEKNLGIGSHLNKVWFDIAKGEWIVVSAGDDVSVPCRIERLMQHINSSISAIHHHSERIDAQGNILPEWSGIYSYIEALNKNNLEDIIRNNNWLIGSTMCLNKKMLNHFGPFNDNIINEDVILAYRSFFYGKILFLDEKLLKYRVHRNSETQKYRSKSFSDYKNTIIYSTLKEKIILKQVKDDSLKLGLSKIFLQELNNKICKNEIILFFYKKDNFKLKFITTLFFYEQFLRKLFLFWIWRIKN